MLTFTGGDVWTGPGFRLTSLKVTKGTDKNGYNFCILD